MKARYIKLSIFLLFSLGSSYVQAQDHVFRPGVILNFNGIHIEGENSAFWQSGEGKIWGTGGISFGGFVTYDRYNKVIGTLELRYIRKGGLYEFINDWGQREFESLKLIYIEMPVLLGFKFNSKKVSYQIETGIGMARLLNSQMIYDELSERFETPHVADFKKYDLSWIVDIKFNINKSNTLLLGARFEYSILSIHKSYNLRNMTYGIELDYLLFNKKLNRNIY